MSSDASPPQSAQPKKALSLLDSTSLVVGIVIGVGVFTSSGPIAASLNSGFQVVCFWILGGIISLAGALCYAELASCYPKEGGDFVYLNRALGPVASFLFAWAHLSIIRPATIAAISFACSKYFIAFLEQGFGVTSNTTLEIIIASSAVIFVTTINSLGIREGKWTQNILTFLKIFGILLVIACACWVSTTSNTQEKVQSENTPSMALAIILILFTFGGWNEMAYVAQEVKNPERNIVRSLFLGTLVITLIYVLLNLGFLNALGHDGLAQSGETPATQVLEKFSTQAQWSNWPAIGISALICISALGALNGFFMTGARITYALGSRYKGLKFLGHWHPKLGTPVRALCLQGALGIGLVIYLKSFQNSVVYAATTLWGFFLLTGISVFILRQKDRDRPRPFKVPLYPLTPILFCLTSLVMIYSAIDYKPWGSLISLGIILAGLPLMLILRIPFRNKVSSD